MDINKILDEKQPPSGGLFRLNQRIRRKSTRRRKMAAFGVALIALCLWFVFLPMTGRKSLPEIQVESPLVVDAAVVKVVESERVIYYQLVKLKSGGEGDPTLSGE